ncbi:DUF3261 domain-containing protein [Pseudoalteromonas sp. T1lg75]|uniref:DUF3261 domain-containing protein n=1 Tax=Pseudoalteromonas sp. T1lg75 TaxID=2077102 RepID=UPI000CF6ABC4|nr:DUF3261 domain-containing protein [Pseudoalteromonas sp. T1lg75]
MRWLCLLLIFVLSGCANHTKIEQDAGHGAVMLTADVGLALSAPPAELFNSHWQKRMYVTKVQTQQALLSQLAIDNDGELRLALMSAAGLPVFTLSYTADQGVVAQRFIAVEDLDPSYILADIQLVHWPIAQLNNQLQGAQLHQYRQGGELIRELRQNDSTLLDIRYGGEVIILNNKIHHYEIRFEEVKP